MTDLSLNVCATVQKNNGHYFLEDIRVNNSKSSNVFKIDFNDQPIQYHKLFEEKLNRKKTKQLIYIQLTGSDLEKYYDVRNQKFVFNEKELEPVTLVDDFKYNIIVNPEVFIKRFESKFGKKDETIKLDMLIKSVDQKEQDELIFK